MNRLTLPSFFSLPAFVIICAAGLALAAGCAGRPESPIIALPADWANSPLPSRIDALLPADVILLGEQHDAAEHQEIEQQVVAHLAARRLLAAVALEMADNGVSTAQLKPSSGEEQTRNALQWNNKGWPWKSYGPAIMTAVQAGIPVLGANLPPDQMKDRMADSTLDVQLPGPAFKAQQQLIRSGHCELLPENQISPMTRVQIAKDITMANTIAQAALPGKVVLLLSGSGHADRALGVPQHLPSDLKVKAVRLRAANNTDNAASGSFDAIWPTPAAPEKDYCEGLRQQFELDAKPGKH